MEAPLPSILDWERPSGPGAPYATLAPYAPLAPKEAPRWQRRALLFAATLLLVLLLVCAAGSRCRMCRFAGSRGLSEGLADRGWSVYYREGCGYCDKQAALLGAFPRHVRYAADGTLRGGYTETPPLGFDAIQGFPAWHNTTTGETRVGLQDAAALARMAAA